MGRRQYIGARYVPKIFNWEGSSEWRSGVAYEALTIVTRNGNSYTSKIPVPSNIGEPERNPTYWSITGFKGDTGNGIASIEKTGTSYGVDTYTITMTDGTTYEFTVTNGVLMHYIMY